MKKIVTVLLVTIMVLSLSACGGNSGKKETYNITDFETLLSSMPVFVTSTKYVVQDEKYKALYPDMLQVILKNNTSYDIKNAVVAFVAWDENNLPVKIKGDIDFSDGAYIRQVNYDDINLVPNGTFGESSGFSIAEDSGISTFKAIVVSYETFEGDTWDNPYYDEFCSLYEGVKFNEELTVEVNVVDVTFESSNTETEGSKTDSGKEDTALSEADLLAQIEEQEVKVISTKYVVQDEEYKSLYPDMLQAIIQNNTSYDIKDAVVAFVAWDKNNLPVKIKGDIDFSGGEYIQQVKYSDINMVPNSTFGKSNGYSIDADCGISSFKAIVVSYETFEGDTWDNPLYEDWCKLYEGKKLKE